MITWSDQLATGHPMVDSDHKKLIDMLNQLEASLRAGAARDELTRMINFLVEYTHGHFAREEAHMRAVKCPSMLANCQAHAALTLKLDGWKTRLEKSGPTTSLVLEIFNETSAWIRSHIAKVDCQLRGCKVS